MHDYIPRRSLTLSNHPRTPGEWTPLSMVGIRGGYRPAGLGTALAAAWNREAHPHYRPRRAAR